MAMLPVLTMHHGPAMTMLHAIVKHVALVIRCVMGQVKVELASEAGLRVSPRGRYPGWKYGPRDRDMAGHKWENGWTM